MKLSIITICLNDKNGIVRTIKSVLSQNSSDFEFIIIDGGSNDGSKEIIIQNSKRINYWISEPDKGIYNAMNKGIAVATGEYCIFLNSGDVFFDDKSITRFLNSMPQEDILTGNTAFNSNGKYIKFIEAPRKVNVMYFMSASLSHQSTFIKTSLLKTHPYLESYKIVSDFIFFFEMLVLNDSTYRKLNFFVSNSDFGGISNTNLPKLFEEKNRYLNSILPPKLHNELQSYAWNYKDFWGLGTKNYLYKYFITARRLFFFLFTFFNRIRNKLKIIRLNFIK